MDTIERDEYLRVIDTLVNELLDRGGITKPPVDVIELARKTLGITICLDEREGRRSRTRRIGGERQIYLRPEPRVERHQWTVAQSIGSQFKAEVLARLGADASRGESLINLFAQRLLVPTRWFADSAAERSHDVLALKEVYTTASHEVVAWRLLDLPDPCVMTIFDNNVIHRRRSNAWLIRRELEPAEKKCQKQVHHTGAMTRVRIGDWTVDGWPVHEGDWKREILRSVRDEW